MAKNSAVFEIQPSNFMGVWARGVCTLVGVRWHGYFCPSPEEETPIYVEGELRPGVHFTWRLPLGGFLEQLDAYLAA
jgi:capsular polysaccharide biosynthesis protein